MARLWASAGVRRRVLGLTVDLAYRVTHSREEEWWRFFKPTTGGQLCWVPVWCLGVAWICVATIHVIMGGSQDERLAAETIAFVEETAKWLKGLPESEPTEQARQRVERCEVKLAALVRRWAILPDADLRRLDARYGVRLQVAVRALEVQKVRLNLVPD
jgi:hypothetical protein